MKTNRLYAFAIGLASVVASAALFSGCGKSQSNAPVPDAFKSTSPKSAVPTSFNDVAKNLDAGGDFYLYVSTEQWLTGLSDKISKWRGLFSDMPMDDNDRSNMDKVFNIATRVVSDSGLEDISGFGMSSIAIDKDLYRTKMVLHHYPGKGTGFGWTMFGKAPHALNGLDMAPASTAIAIFSDADFAQLWSVVQDEVKHSGFPEAQQFLDQVPAQFKQATGMDWDKTIGSLGVEYGILFTLDTTKKISIPVPQAGMVEIPEPGLLIAVKVDDDTVFNRLEQLLTQTGMEVIRADKGDVKMRTVAVPLPLPMEVRPTVATGGGWLFIATSDALVQEALEVKSGAQPGLKSTDEFKKLSQGMPTTGNRFSFVSKRFGTNFINVERQMVAASPNAQSPGVSQMMSQLMDPDKAQDGFSVGSTTEEGWVAMLNGSQSGAKVAMLLPAVAVGGLLAAIAIPNFVKARETAQRNACINNLRQIDAAKDQWALENKKNTTAVPTEDDITPYLKGGMPVCPAGGVYTIGSISTIPSCSIHGQLP